MAVAKWRSGEEVAVEVAARRDREVGSRIPSFSMETFPMWPGG